MMKELPKFISPGVYTIECGDYSISLDEYNKQMQKNLIRLNRIINIKKIYKIMRTDGCPAH